MDSTKELRETRQTSYKAMADLLESAQKESRDLTAEESEQFDKASVDYDALTSRIQRAERVAQLAAESTKVAEQRAGRDPIITDSGAAPKTEPRHYAQAFRAWCRSQFDLELSAEDQDACKRTGVRPNARELEIQLPDARTHKRFAAELRANPFVESRALSAIVGASGGFTVPEGFVPEWERALLAFGGARPAFGLMRTDSGADLPWPTTDDTSNKGVQISENTQVTEQDVTVGQKVFHAYKFSSRLVRVPIELLEDSAFDIATELGSMLGERLGRILAEKSITGTGAAEPEGILTAAPLGVTSLAVGVLAADDLIDLQHSIDPAYRTGASWVMSDGLVQTIRKLKTGLGEYLFFDSQRGEFAFDRLLGSQVWIDQEMPQTVATGTKVALYGDMTKFKLREVRGIRLRRLVERYADFDQEGFVAFMRFDSGLLDAGTGPIKHLVIQ